ncbi:MAG: DUF3307 domain-containing protein [Verrucomicrobia bacterium]|nr:DUF3307 domain-containing protein [Verrucomicrobiota bacterium]
MQALQSVLPSLTDPGRLFFALLIGHMLADYPLQTEFMAVGKNHRKPRPLPGGLAQTRGVWVHCLTAHALVHAGVVWVITGSVTLALLETVLHWIIDFVKSEGWTNLHVDQILHLLCKAAYVGAIHLGWVVATG